MKGIVFTSFTSFVETAFGEEYLDLVLGSVDLPSNGAYTSVGTYPHEELLQMLVFISGDRELPAADLAEAFGEHMFSVLEGNYAELLANYHDSFECIYHVDQTIHRSVRKIYPDAELPNLNAQLEDDGNVLHLDYQSTRPLMHFALGLIKGCARHYGECLSIEMSDQSDGRGDRARFRISRDATQR